MRERVRTGLAILVSVIILSASGSAEAQGRGGSGGGGGGGQGGSGGGGTSGGGSQAAILYGDLYVVERDGSGIPVTKTFTVPGEAGVTTETCLQPLASSCALLPLKGADPNFNPAVDEACDVQTAYVAQLQPVSFGRQSVARASSVVIDRAYYEALTNFNLAAVSGAPVPYGLDPAGRLVLALPDEITGELIEKTIDAPLENLGLYRALMTTGCLGPVTIERQPGVPLTTQLSAAAVGFLQSAGFGHLVCGSAPGIEDLDLFRAAAFYAAAADKTDPVTLDEVVHVNTYLGINVLAPGTTPRTKKQVTISWFTFEVGGVPYRYDRATTHPATPTAPGNRVLPAEAAILTDASPSGAPGTVFQAAIVPLFAGAPPGVDLPAVNVQVCRGGVPQAPCLSTSDPGGACGGANWFTQTAEDARKINWFLHNWTVPEVAY